nr:MAG TPA: RING finger protein Z FEVER VIRUS-Z, RING, NEGATIVE [Bacteriophage sp.]
MILANNKSPLKQIAIIYHYLCLSCIGNLYPFRPT